MSTINELRHHTEKILDGGEVLVLNTGAIIDPEAAAMIQALHSRSIGGVRKHLEVLAEKGADKFMSSFYVGYGHKSIGDCGTTIIFIEGVSMLVAKAIQDSPLYSGQEASTRYIDFEHQPFINPVKTKDGEDILEAFRAFYMRSMEPVKESLRVRFPKAEEEDEKIYQKAISARAFDTLRGFLPAGATTNLAWAVNLRQAADHLMLLRHHPLEEVRNTAKAIELALQSAHPSSFGHKRYDATEEYNARYMMEDYYYHNPSCPEYALTNDSVRKNMLSRTILASRPAKTELPKKLAEAGTVQFEFLLDFGSFRDIQRHRAVIQQMPLLTDQLGFGEWYLNELPDAVQTEALTLLETQKTALTKLGVSKEVAQYYLPMGYKISNRLTGGLPALVYLVELRTTRFVHPTLRRITALMANDLIKIFGSSGLVIHLDPDMDRFDIKRGTHDIVAKP